MSDITMTAAAVPPRALASTRPLWHLVADLDGVGSLGHRGVPSAIARDAVTGYFCAADAIRTFEAPDADTRTGKAVRRPARIDNFMVRGHPRGRPV